MFKTFKIYWLLRFDYINIQLQTHSSVKVNLKLNGDCNLPGCNVTPLAHETSDREPESVEQRELIL